jgi:predicted lysophospholipase L1 biosynthesis ABC-type transport system permease subunit
LSLFFGLVIWLISKLPVPERINIAHLALIVVMFALSVAVYTQLPAFGMLLLIFSVLGLLVVFIPRTLKATTKMALRNLGRQRTRTTTTMLALFVGIFTIGLIVVLGQNLRDQVNHAIATALNYNVFAITTNQDATKLRGKFSSIPGLSTYQEHTLATTSLLSINNKTLQEILYPGQVQPPQSTAIPGRTQGTNQGSLPGGIKPGSFPQGGKLPQSIQATATAQAHKSVTGQPSSGSGQSGQQQSGPVSTGFGHQALIYFLSGVEGYDVANNQLPRVDNAFTIQSGRNLNSHDAGTYNVVVSSELEQTKEIKLKLNDKVTLESPDRMHTVTVTIVGFYQRRGFGMNLYPILGTKDTTKALSPNGLSQSVFYLKIDPNKLNAAQDAINKAVPNAFMLSLANISDFINQLLNDILLTLTSIASLSLLAGVIIIANAVALAMLERRRELGILKSVGYKSSAILSEVLLENGIVGGTGALLAMLLVTAVTVVLGNVVFKSGFSVSPPVALGMVAGSALLAMLTAALVAWGAVRVRPLEVLRYE